MARMPRYLPPGQPQHVIQRGNNRQAVFHDEGDFRFYLGCLREAASRYGCAVHAYVLMTNHVHLLVSPAAEDGLPRAMQLLGMRYTRRFNRRQGRSGTLWEARYRATLVDTDEYFFTCSRYIELNPVRAGIVDDPGRYAWSSYGVNAGGEVDPLVTPHDLYQALGPTAARRHQAYRALFATSIEPRTLSWIRDSTENGWPLGGAAFRAEVESRTGRRATPSQRGGTRPGAGRPGLINNL